MRRFLPLLTAALCLTLALPATAGRVRDELALLQREFREMQQLLEAERARSEQLSAELADLRRLTGVDDAGRLSAADLAARLDGLDRDVQVLFENQNESRRQLSVLMDKVDALYRHQGVFGGAPTEGSVMTSPIPGDEEMSFSDAPAQPETALPQAPPVPGEAVEIGGAPELSAPVPPAGGLLDPEELYRAARADYGRGDYALAIEGFKEFVDRFPGSELADNAWYWVGESHWAEREHEAALSAFDVVLQEYPEADKAPDAGLKRGFCLLELNRMADGIIQLQHVKDAHPGTAASRLAREKLESLGLM